MSNRREVVLGGLLTITSSSLATCICQAQPLAQQPIYGCILPRHVAPRYLQRSTESRLYITGNEAMIPKSGDKDFDFALAHMLAHISSVLQVLPGFAYYEDSDAENAYATSAVKQKNGDGTVLFGLRLLKRLLAQKENPDVSVAAICAHEFGHILQFKHGLDRTVGEGQSTVKRVELQADFLAGYFAGVRKLEKPEFPAAVFALTQFNNGDEMSNHPGHHGTPAERGAAISRGFETAYRDKRELATAIQASTNYVTRL